MTERGTAAAGRSTASASIRVRAYAKVNVALEVLGRRPDGYHEICTVLQAAGLFDELVCEPAPELTLESPPLPD